MKVLDRYILFSFLKTFFSVFLILMFIFLLQTIWLFISELAGKDLEIIIIFKFLVLVSPRLVPLVLPLSILLTSIMTFGNFAENYEFAAMKSSGISLQRAMRSLTVFILLLSVTAFFFANNVIPYSEKKFTNLRKNIVQLKPARAITENRFNEVGDINIKVSEKYGDNDQYLKDVIIHKQSPSGNGSFTVINAISGELEGSEKSDLLSLVLFDGNYYHDINPSDYKKRKRKPFAKSYFKEYRINMDLSSLDEVDLEEESISRKRNMLNIKELRKEIDSFSTSYTKNIKDFGDNFYRRSGLVDMDKYLKGEIKKEIDTTCIPEPAPVFLNNFDLEQQVEILEIASNSTSSVINNLEAKNREFRKKEARLNKFEISLHEKYVLGIACIILFFVGAPLGAIIRKGGMGLPMVVAIGFFLSYHFIGIFAKNSAEDGSVSPFVASWLSTLIILPLGVFLTYRATKDLGLISVGGLMADIKNRFFKGKSEEKNTIEKSAYTLAREKLELEEARNAGQQEATDTVVLPKISEEQMAYKKFSQNSWLAVGFCLIALIGFIPLLLPSLSDSGFLLEVNKVFYFVRPIMMLLFFIFGIKALKNQTRFNSLIGKKKDISIWIIFFLLSLIAYVFMHFYFKKEMKEELKQIT